MELHSRGHVSSAGNLLPDLVGNLIRNFRTALPQYCFVVAEMGKSLLCRPQREISIYHYEVSVKLKAGNFAAGVATLRNSFDTYVKLFMLYHLSSIYKIYYAYKFSQ